MGMRRLIPLTLTLLLVAACDMEGQGPMTLGNAAAPPERVVAVVGPQAITVDELQEQVNRESAFVRARYGAPEKLKEYLDNLVRFEVLYQEAKRRGYENDPDIVRIYKQQMVSRLLQKDFEPQHDPMQIPEDAVRQYWESHKEEFHEPEKVRAAHILVTTPKALEAATKAIDSFRNKANKEADWAQAVKTFSEDMGSKPVAGDLGWLTRDKKVKEVEVIERAFAMTTPGEISEPVASVSGHHFIRYLGRKPQVERSYDEAAKAARVAFFKKMREEALSQWVAGLRGKTQIEKFEDNLAKVKVDTSDVPAPDTRPPFFQNAGDFLPGTLHMKKEAQ